MENLTTNHIVKLTRQVAAVYIDSGSNKSFGAWVMSTCYANEPIASDVNVSDFISAQRTIDARMYLSGLLRDGLLKHEPLQNLVDTVEVSERATHLSFVI